MVCIYKVLSVSDQLFRSFKDCFHCRPIYWLNIYCWQFCLIWEFFPDSWTACGPCKGKDLFNKIHQKHLTNISLVRFLWLETEELNIIKYNGDDLNYLSCSWSDHPANKKWFGRKKKLGIFHYNLLDLMD